jgi:DNA-binding IclR family transcriptional regulator
MDLLKMAKLRGMRTGIQSIEVGAPLLATLTDANEGMTLTALAAATHMTPSKAHKYLASFARVGLVSQSASSGRYDLGPLAVELGFAALRRLDVVEFAQDVLDALRDRLNLAGSLTVWGNHGPTIVRRSDNRQPVSLVVQLGLVLPLLTSSNGQVFATYLDRSITQKLIEAELAAAQGAAARAGLHSMADVEQLLAKVRKNGIAFAEGLVYPGVASMSAPVFDQGNALVAAMTVVGAQGRMNMSLRGKPAQTLAAAAMALSRRLGARMPRQSLPPRPQTHEPRARLAKRTAAAAANDARKTG